MDKITFLKEKTLKAKRRCLEMCLKGGYGHPTSAYSCAEIVTALYYDVMHYKVSDPQWSNRDRFVMSKNHGSVILMPILNDLGIMTDDEYQTIMQEGSARTNHTNVHLAGMDFTGGALGIGLGVATGLAMGAKMNCASWLTFVVIGDAECYEGSIWEAALFAGHYRLNNLIVFLDRNYLGITDFTENMLELEPLEDKFRACNWTVKRINGHSIEEILGALGRIRNCTATQPLCIIADTVKGKGVDFMENVPLYHGNLPKCNDIEKARFQLGGDDFEK